MPPAAPSPVEIIFPGISGGEIFQSDFSSSAGTMRWLDAAIPLREGYWACVTKVTGRAAVKNGHHIWPKPTSNRIRDSTL